MIVAFMLLINCIRIYPIASIAVACVIGAGLAGLWVRAGRPRGIAMATIELDR